MASIEDVLKKNKKKIAKIKTERKKIKRSGPVRPWQESLSEYQETQLDESNTSLAKKDKIDSEVRGSPVIESAPTLSVETNNIDFDDSRSSISKPNHIRINSESIPNHKGSSLVADTESIPNEDLKVNHSQVSIINKIHSDLNRTNSELNPNQTDDKPDLNRIESEFIPNPKSNDNFLENSINNECSDNKNTHTESIPNPNRINSELNRIESESVNTSNRVVNEPHSESIPNHNRIKYEPDGYINHTKFAMLSNLKQLILNNIYEECRLVGDRVTRPFRMMILSEKVGCKYDSCRNAIRQLERDGFLRRASTKRGQGGFVQLELNEHVYTYISASLQNGLYRSISEFDPNQNRMNSAPHTESKTESNSSSKLVTNIKETNFTNRKKDIFEFFENTDFSMLETNEVLYSNRITRDKVLSEIAKNDWDIKPFELEETISKFATYVSDKNNIYNVRSIQGLFFSQLKKLHNNDFLDIESVESENDQSLVLMKQKLLAKKAKREQLKQEIIDLTFEEWWETSTREDQEVLSPGVFKISDDLNFIKKGVKGGWLENYWPNSSEYKDYINSINKKSDQILDSDNDANREV